MLSPSVKAIEFTALLASIGFFGSFLAKLAGPGLGLLLGPGFLLGAGAGAAGDESLDFSEADPTFGVFLAVGVGLGFFLISESESDLFDFFCTLASSTEEDSLDFLALDLGDLTDAGISLLRAFFASSKAESSPKIVKFMVKV